MHYSMDDGQLASPAAMQAFVLAAAALDITNTSSREEKYRW